MARSKIIEHKRTAREILEENYGKYDRLTELERQEAYAPYVNKYGSIETFHYIYPGAIKKIVHAIIHISVDMYENGILFTKQDLAMKLGVAYRTLNVWCQYLPDVKQAYEHFQEQQYQLYLNMFLGFFLKDKEKQHKINPFGFEAFKKYGIKRFNVSEFKINKLDQMTEAKTVEDKFFIIDEALEKGELTSQEYYQLSSALNVQISAKKIQADIEAGIIDKDIIDNLVKEVEAIKNNEE